MKKQLVISFIHSNYITKAGGTEKFVLELSDVYRDLGMNHLCFFAFVKQKGTHGEEIVGVNYNDKFFGIYPANDINNVIIYFVTKYNLAINCFHLQHLMNHNIDVVRDVLDRYSAGVVIFLHDFYLCCCSEHLINSNGDYCGELTPSEEKCSKCEYWSSEKEHIEKYGSLFGELKGRVISIVAPSNYVARVFRNCYPSFCEKLIVRPHLVSSKVERLAPIENNIHIAYIGRQRKQKGYEKWKEVLAGIDVELKNEYDFYYLGMDNEDIKDVCRVNVITTPDNPNAMSDAIRENDISCAFLWPLCGETYSYVYYELISSGAFVLTNGDSGNISDEVKATHNGIVFNNVSECIKWLSDPEIVKVTINEFRTKNSISTAFKANKNIEGLFNDKTYSMNNIKLSNPKKDIIFTLIYRYKYRKLLK